MTITKGSLSQGRAVLPITPPEIDGVPSDTSIVREAGIEHKGDKHSYAYVVMTTTERRMERLKKKPIFFRFGNFPGFGYFYGYVTDAEKVQPFQGQTTVRLSCLGWSYPLKASQPNMWTNVTCGQLINEIARKHGFGFHMPENEYVFPRIAQADKSDLQIARDTAFTIARTMILWDGVIRVIDPIDELNSESSVFTFEKSSNILDPPEFELLSFDSQVRQDSGDDDGYVKFSYFTSSNEVRTNNQDDVVEEDKRQVTSSYIHNESVAHQFDTTIRRLESIEQFGTARIRGNGAVAPGSVIGISTGAPRSTSSDSMDGRWFVLGVDHMITEEAFQTEVTVYRDKHYHLNDTPYDFYKGDGRAAPRLTLSPDSKWVSSWR